ncbi:MAG: tryptophan synthase subunit alpha [Omnitrophica WOR_2 bacterium RIFCSPLOWO2_12_FULL_50_9]|nr:MAG: tryptophan synthase subunit alpha [Omnitrophica WOR_2 bacterium RIFCSPHIGHO2_02_FULL_50_17]OGX41421.1 MAG: tryptophan synthase subunit alpha [Omnitrophica WOR_2 bacterium RIFCSPLOWO2_12_FULL_50_9]
MNNRIDQKFKELRKKKRKAFIAFITAGDPSLKITEELVVAFEKTGVDIVELGVPFSDPLADGPTIQASSLRALHRHVNLFRILDTVKRIRQRSQMPIALMTYYNPVFHYGEEKFIVQAKQCGVDGLIIPDLPPEEGGALIKSARAQDMATVFFLAPTTTPQRMRYIAQASSGFIYYVSLTGVTGARRQLSFTIKKQVDMARQLTKKPVCVGFGVSTPFQVKAMAQIADGVIVGSAIVNEIEKNRGHKRLVQNVSRFVARLSAAVSIRMTKGF